MFKQINISDEEASRDTIYETVLTPPPALNTSETYFNKKVTVDESQNRVHLFVEEIETPPTDVNLEEDNNGFMSKFKVAEKTENDDVYQELRQVQRKQQQQHQELLLKMEDLTKKVDMIIDLIRSRPSSIS